MLKVNKLTKKFGENTLFEDFSLEIELNTITVIYGPSGSGKTTLLNIIGGLEPMNKGKIEIDGKTLKHDEKSRRETFNYIFQNFALVDEKSIEQNLMFGLKYCKLSNAKKKQKMIESLNFVRLDKDLSTKVYTLSGGEQQRVAIARTILKPGSIVMCDEPTGSLDESNSKKILNLFVKMKNDGKTLIIVSHDPLLKEIADNVIEL